MSHVKFEKLVTQRFRKVRLLSKSKPYRIKAVWKLATTKISFMVGIVLFLCKLL